MTNERKDSRKWTGRILLLTSLVALAIVVCFSFVVYQPDRPVPDIAPGSSSGPAFVVQVIRPRLGLPLGGIVPPQFFGVDANLIFNSTTAGASIGNISPDRIELSADKWELVLVFDGDGRVSPETFVVFDLVFEDRLRTVRCWPGEPAIGTVQTAKRATTGHLSGNFNIELARCEDADTGKPLGWPPKPLVLHGSFDQLSMDNSTER